MFVVFFLLPAAVSYKLFYDFPVQCRLSAKEIDLEIPAVS